MSATGAMRQVRPSGKVIAIEADPDIYALARRNFARNGLETIESHHAAAVADPAITVSPKDGQSKCWRSTRLRLCPSNGQERESCWPM